MRLLLCLVITVTVCIALAIPTQAIVTGGVAATTSNSTILHGSGCTGAACYFVYGFSSGASYPWVSYNCTPSGGDFATEIAGLPLVSGITVYYRAVDSDGTMGNELSVTLLPIVTHAEPTFGQHMRNITKSRWSVPVTVAEIFGPYFDTVPMAVFTTLMMFMLFAGLVVSGKSVMYAFTLFAIISSIMVGGGVIGYLQLSPEAFHMAQVIAAVTIAGMAFTWLKR